MEFASGNYGLLETALQYAFDDEPPVVDIVPNGGVSQNPILATFEYVTSPGTVYYTLDGSTPTISSITWNATGPRPPGQVFRFDETTTIQWIAEDIKGNLSEVRPARFVIESAPINEAQSPAPVSVPSKHGRHRRRRGPVRRWRQSAQN